MNDRHHQRSYPLRMDDELRQELEAAAQRGLRSLNAEIILRLRESLEPQQAWKDPLSPVDNHLRERLVEAARKSGRELGAEIAARLEGSFMSNAPVTDEVFDDLVREVSRAEMEVVVAVDRLRKTILGRHAWEGRVADTEKRHVLGNHQQGASSAEDSADEQSADQKEVAKPVSRRIMRHNRPKTSKA